MTLVELPLARALIQAHGMEIALEVLSRYGEDDVDERIQRLAWQAVGSKIERYDQGVPGEVHLQSVFTLSHVPDDDPTALSRAVYWDNEGIVLCGRTIPETVAADLPGRSMTDVLDHPWLAGLTISTVTVDDEDGGAVVVDASDSMRPLDRLGEAA